VLRVSWKYFSSEVFPRSREILLCSEFVVSVLVGSLIAVYGSAVLAATMTAASALSSLLTYASIAFGFSLAGLTIALTLPDQDFARQLSRSIPTGKRFDAYSDLLFVFSWTAITHWVLLVVVLGLSAVVGPEEIALPTCSSGVRRILAGAAAALTCYGVLQFLVVVITLSQVGSVLVHRLSGRGKGNGEERL